MDEQNPETICSDVWYNVIRQAREVLEGKAEMALYTITEEDVRFYIRENYYKDEDEKFADECYENTGVIAELATRYINEGDTQWANLDDLVFPCISDAIGVLMT